MTPVARRRLGIAILLLLWLGAMGWLVFMEAYPDLLSRAAPGYRALLSQGVMVMDRWMTITYQGQPIGYTHTSVDVDSSDPLRQYRLYNRTLLSLNVMGHRQRIAVNAEAGVDTLFNLQSFTFSLSSSGYTLLVDGHRQHGQEFEVRIRGPGSVQRLTITIPPEAIVYSPLTELRLKALKPGNHVTLRVFNPVTLTAQNATIKALRRETLAFHGQSLDTTVLATLVDGLETLSWMDRDGTVLRQTTPFGWAMESASAEEALAASPAGEGPDLLAAMAVPLRGDPTRLHAGLPARLRLTGAPLSRQQLASHRQEVIAAGPDATEIVVHPDTLPSTGCPREAIPPDLHPWLAASAFIQSGDPRLVSKAREITGNWTNSLEAALALYRWVNTHVTKTPLASLPSALDVLQKPEGDCNEHTYLFAGLARAAGLPTRIRIGVTLHEGRFYYHAWPSVYVGRWLDMDPTRGLPAVNAGYISLLEGEIAEQMKLMGVIGQLKVEIP